MTPDTGELKQEQWQRVERDESALKEEKVSVTSGKKKASVRKETDAVSDPKPKIGHKSQNTLPPRLLSQPYHEVEVVSKKRSIQGKSNMGPFFDNRADRI